MRHSSRTAPSKAAVIGKIGVSVVIGNGISSDGAATSRGTAPSVGVFIVGGRNHAAIRTFERTAWGLFTGASPGSARRSCVAGEKSHPRTVRTTSTVNGGVSRSGLTSSTAPCGDRDLDKYLTATYGLNWYRRHRATLILRRAKLPEDDASEDEDGNAHPGQSQHSRILATEGVAELLKLW